MNEAIDNAITDTDITQLSLGVMSVARIIRVYNYIRIKYPNYTYKAVGMCGIELYVEGTAIKVAILDV